MSPEIVGIIGIIVLLMVFLAGVPVAFGMALIGFIGFAYIVSPEGALAFISRDIWFTFSNYSLTVIPLFVFMGQIAFNTGVSERLYSSAYRWLGQFRGGLAMTTIGACAGFAAICGSNTATTATMGIVALPEMKKYGYDSSLATGAVASGGTLGPLIPPSVLFIVYGVLVEQSIGQLFMAGIFPGIILSGLFMGSIYVMCRRNPKLGPAGPKTSFREKIVSLAGLAETIVLFILVIGGLYIGWFSPTEAGAVGAAGAVLIGLVRRNLSWRGFKKAVVETTRTSGMVMFLLAGATIFGHFLTVSEITSGAAVAIGGLPWPPVAILALILIVYLIGGCIMDALAFLILTIPIFYPIIIALGYDPIWYGVIMCLVSLMGGITPPVGINVYVTKGIAPEVPIETIFKGALIFLIPFAICLVILVAFPQISLFLPRLMY